MERVVLVTGGSGRLGSAVTEAFLEDGWRVAVPTHGSGASDALDDLAAWYGERLTRFRADLATEAGADEAVARTASWGGRMDAVVHTVGGYAGGAALHETAVHAWDAIMSINLRSAFLVARAAIPRLAEGGSLVFVSSRAAVKGRKGHAAYAISKAALLTLTEAIAEENGGRVRANAVLPGTIDTPANRASMPGASYDAWTPPAEIARVILFLASAASGTVNGAAVPVYGDS
ncbi:SDR family oxidoreductase [Longimicrobium sp.]|uniref:SDR family oxidoreductase n=1 Tax=Longimicrobium sp. TaxID=2029185 RepID=UPI003B3AD244